MHNNTQQPAQASSTNQPPLHNSAHKTPPQRLEQIDVDEKEIATIRRHPFGLFLLFFQVIVGFGVASILIYFLLPSLFSSDNLVNAQAWAATAIFLLLLPVMIILIVASHIYRVSRLIITDKTITQVLQDGLFNRKVSQLSIGDVEDVTADRRGVFQTIFNYGVLNIETAGEQVNFHFTFCPNPNYYARQILEASECFHQPGDH